MTCPAWIFINDSDFDNTSMKGAVVHCQKDADHRGAHVSLNAGYDGHGGDHQVKVKWL